MIVQKVSLFRGYSSYLVPRAHIFCTLYPDKLYRYSPLKTLNIIMPSFRTLIASSRCFHVSLTLEIHCQSFAINNHITFVFLSFPTIFIHHNDMILYSCFKMEECGRGERIHILELLFPIYH